MVETRIITIEDVFTQNLNIVNEDGLDKALREEMAWADEANRERERLKEQVEKEELIAKIIGIAIFLVGSGIVIFFIFKIVKYAKILLKTEKTKPEQELEYFRDFPDADATPAEAALLYYFDKKSLFTNSITKIVSATMLSLALKKAITFEEVEKKNVRIIITKPFDWAKIKGDEKNIYDMLLKVEEYTRKNSQEEVNGITMKDIEKYAKKNDRAFLSKIEGIEKIVQNSEEQKGNYDKKLIEEATKWKKKKEGFYIAAFMCFCFGAFILPLFAVIPCIVCGIICGKIEKKSRNLTQKGTNEKEEWKALKNYMENFSLLNEREIPELALWEKYLVYATAFGVADKVLDQLKLKYPELTDENYMINNGYTYMYMINRYNFDRMVGSGMQRAYNAGISARQARQAAASSSYSSGGGFGRRIFRRRPEVGGGRRPEWAEDK